MTISISRMAARSTAFLAAALLLGAAPSVFAQPRAASQSVPVTVPAGLNQAPFNVARKLTDRNSLAVALHGCWNCTAFNGHKVTLYPVSADGSLGAEVDLVTGWIIDPAAKTRWGRPVSVVGNGKGGLYISDDYSGTVYLLSSG